MLSIFRPQSFANQLLLLIYTLILYSPSFLHDHPSYVDDSGVFGQWFSTWLVSDSFSLWIIVPLLIWINSALINYNALEMRLNDLAGLWPGLFYIIFATFMFEFEGEVIFLLAQTCLILALSNVYQITGNKSHSATRIFNSAFWLSIAILFKPIFIWFIPALIIHLVNAKPVRTGDLLIHLSGYFVPAILVFTYFFWFDQTGYLYSMQCSKIIAYQGFNTWFLSILSLVKVLIYLVIIVILFFRVNELKLKLNQSLRIIVGNFYWLLAFSLVAILLAPFDGMENMLLLAIPLGYLCSRWFQIMSPRLAETVHMIIIIIILGMKLLPIAA